MIVETDPTNHQSIAAVKEERALEICSLVIMETVFQEFTSVMETMIAWTILMKIQDISAVSSELLAGLEMLITNSTLLSFFKYFLKVFIIFLIRYFVYFSR